MLINKTIGCCRFVFNQHSEGITNSNRTG
ncbi:helix-turn-helix domain-containing protein [Domibacillus sp. PGB-M46]|nr:helix-turn-helix domain-containing protein [Domibacillus sp. PGB-M46]